MQHALAAFPSHCESQENVGNHLTIQQSRLYHQDFLLNSYRKNFPKTFDILIHVDLDVLQLLPMRQRQNCTLFFPFAFLHPEGTRFNATGGVKFLWDKSSFLAEIAVMN